MQKGKEPWTATSAILECMVVELAVSSAHEAGIVGIIVYIPTRHRVSAA